MKNFIRQSQGFTLVEVMIAIVIEGIMLGVVAMLLLNMNVAMLKGREDMELLSGYRAAKIEIQRELGTADAVTRNVAGTSITLYLGGAAFATIGLVAGEITYDDLNTAQTPDHVILYNVKTLQFTFPFGTGSPIPVSDRMLDIDIELEKVYERRHNSTVNFSDTFRVCVRNLSL